MVERMQTVRGVLASFLIVACSRAPAATPSPSAPKQVAVAQKVEPPIEADPTEPEIGALHSERQRLIASGSLDEADKVCTDWIGRPNPVARAEGYKCLANVFVSRAVDSGDGVMISDDAQRLAVGGTASRPRFSGDAIAKAIDQLDQAAILRPSDISVHQGRLFLALASGSYARSVASLATSLKQHTDAPPNVWLEYLGSFPRTESQHAVAYARLLAARFPKDTEVLAQLGAWLAVAGQTEEAKTALNGALERDKQNAMAHWRLGELLENEGNRAGADEHYRQSLALTGDLSEERKSAYRRFKRAR